MSFFKKLGFILSFCLLAIIAASFIFVADQAPTKQVNASIADNVSGWAWNSNIGWVSFNCTNKACRNIGYQGNFCTTDADCGGAASSCMSDCSLGTNYGVTIDLATGNLSGYAYSSNSGWVSFQETPPETTFRASCQTPSACTGACSACYNSSNGKVFGWAKIINMGDNGWTKLSDDTDSDWVNKGVQINSSGAFTGWAWNANSDGTGIGWISFNCADANAGGCSGHDYHVQANIISQPQNVAVTQAVGSKCSGLKVQWDVPVTGAAGFKIFRDGTQIIADSGTCDEWPLTGGVCTNLGLTANTTYAYKVRACGDEVCAMYNDSASVSGKTNAVCEVTFGSAPATGICPNQINLSWLAAVGSPTSYHIYRCDITGQAAGFCDNEANYAQAGGNCWDTTSTSCTDEVLPLTSKSHQMYYKIAGYNNTVPEEGEWSDKIGPYVACPKKPIWEEVKP
ncbi:MAG: hypothetical protein M0Q92_00595 [Methanoregula sp.]|jgi:hypothetical protein|nr:hypothetical protein [Methanoregula sp.]